MKQLIMITNYFPYGSDTGEMYLRSEIFEASRIFDHITIISCDAKDGDRIFTDKLPQNVQYYALCAHYSKCQQLINSISSNYLKEDGMIISERNINSLTKNRFLNYFLNKTKHRIEKIKKLDIINLNIENEVVIYAYRLFDLAMIGIYLKEHYYKNAVVVSRAHRYDLYEDRNRLNYLPCRVYLMSHLDMVYPCSFDGERYLKQLYKKYEKKISCSYLGTIDYGFKLKTCDTTLQVVSCSNVIPVKRVGKIAEVIVELSKRINVIWTHIGSGVDLKFLKKKYGEEISEGIIVFTGKLQHDQVINLYKHNYYDLFINLSESEGIPQAIMEAFSFGIPVLATNVGGNSEIVQDNSSGYLVSDIVDVQKIADIIERHSKMSLYRVNIMRQNCRRRWEELFNAKVNSERFFGYLFE